MKNVVIVGAGPAGTRAAECLVRHGVRPIVITEAPASGGQVYRRQPAGFARTLEKLYGSEAAKARVLHSTFDALASSIDFRALTTVTNIVGNTLYLDGPRDFQTLDFDALIIATGAMDRVIPMPGWTLPGVFTLGGAQVALKYQACAIGDPVVFAGTGPLLYLVAYQYAKAGARVAGVFDTSTFGNKMAGLAKMLANFRATALGAYYLAWLKTNGVPVAQGVTPLEIAGEGGVREFRYRDAGGAERSVACNAVGLGYGLKPESQLADLAGCRFEYNELQGLWAIAHDGRGLARPGVYVAGDCVAIGGADAAELQGERAALRLLQDRGIAGIEARAAALEPKLAALARFREGLESAFPFPRHLVAHVPKQTLACRCESITVGEMDASIDALAPGEVNRLKAFCRVGMGRCQGRVCGPFVAEYLALRTSKPVRDAGRFRGQAPVKPLACAKAAQLAEPGHEVAR